MTGVSLIGENAMQHLKILEYRFFVIIKENTELYTTQREMHVKIHFLGLWKTNNSNSFELECQIITEGS